MWKVRFGSFVNVQFSLKILGFALLLEHCLICTFSSRDWAAKGPMLQRGLRQHILKSVTLWSTINSWPFLSMLFQVSSTIIEPSDPADMDALMNGLRLLNRGDPFVEFLISFRGEHVVATAEINLY
ncbi:elongation factor EF-2 [Striga asiatica]|uniref:Elongation factor EF-2 n=1 Tax=Striga asiatica TaxID=4170 RepID=A0A5A7PFP4_STRAF|nr:elongation factor EF-2 [Striga asiatica]